MKHGVYCKCHCSDRGSYQGEFPLVGNFGTSGRDFTVVGNSRVRVHLTVCYQPVTVKL